MSALAVIVNICFFAILGLFCLYGVHRYLMIHFFMRTRYDEPRPLSEFKSLPQVTVQLPIFNEAYVAERLIDAVCALDYPPERLEIQVLDDSSDHTADLIAQRVRAYHHLGFDIRHIRRLDREGYKSGALQEGLERARGELIAVFDADFIPPRSFLMDSVHYFTDPKVGMVQHRWDYLNRDHSWLTRVQSVFLDGHFVIEHTARCRTGRFFNFNGTAGIWRRKAITTSGGWSADTLTEDLDLSYRAQLAGWRFVYLKDRSAPCEIPVDLNAFKSQQHRWSKGSIQTARKSLGRVLRSQFGFAVKSEAIVHLTSNLLYPFNVLLALLFLPVVATRVYWGWSEWLAIDALLLGFGTVSVLAFYTVCQRALGRSLWQSLRDLPGLLVLGAGVSLNNTRAVFEGLTKRSSAFVRTPKYGITGEGGTWRDKPYRTPAGRMALAESALGLYLTATLVYSVYNGVWTMLPFIVLFQAGFLVTGLGSMLHSRRIEAPIADEAVNWEF